MRTAGWALGAVTASILIMLPTSAVAMGEPVSAKNPPSVVSTHDWQAKMARRGTHRVSVAPGGEGGNGHSAQPAMSRSGRYVAFASLAGNLVPGDTNNSIDIFLTDRSTRETRLVSAGRRGQRGNRNSYSPSISANGRYVAFASESTNLASSDKSEDPDIFVKDMRTGRIILASTATEGALQPSLSADGRRVSFTGYGGAGGPGIYVHDLRRRRSQLASVGSNGEPANAGCASSDLDRRGRRVAFTCSATNMVEQETTDEQVFVRDLRSRSTMLASSNSGGSAGEFQSGGPAISEDGAYVAFFSTSRNLVLDPIVDGGVFIKALRTNRTTLVSVAFDSPSTAPNGESYGAALSPDGRYVAFVSRAENLVPQDSNGTEDVFVRDLRRAQTSLVSVSSAGHQANDRVYAYLTDRADFYAKPALSRSARHVAFSSIASNLVRNDTQNCPLVDDVGTSNCADVFVRTLKSPRHSRR